MIDIANNVVGEVSDEIKKGSTRIVYFPKNKRKIILDGIETEIETVLKVAKPHTIEIATNTCNLGKCQNKIECELSISEYSVFKKTDNYITNYSGILSPIINFCPNYTWLEMLKINQMTHEIFNQLTTTKIHYCGLGFSDVQNTILKYRANLIKTSEEYIPEYINQNKYEFIMQHQFVRTYCDFMQKYNVFPYDFTLKNLGYIEHPLTKNKIIVLCDYGFTEKYDIFFDFTKKVLDIEL